MKFPFQHAYFKNEMKLNSYHPNQIRPFLNIEQITKIIFTSKIL